MSFVSSEERFDYSDVLLVPEPSDVDSRADVVLTTRTNAAGNVVPIMAANMDHVGTFKMAQALAKHEMMTCLVKHYKVEEYVDFYTKNQNIARFTAVSLGINEDDLKKFETLHENLQALEIHGPSIICVDVANGYSSKFLTIVAQLVTKYHDYYTIMAGNVVTMTGVKHLAQAGVDIVKVGIGPGSACSTRRETGIGYPQLSAVLECSAMASDQGVTVCADGGITCPGDCVKAFAAGAQLVMIGGQFAGHIEGYEDWELSYAKSNGGLPFYGMASAEAQAKHNGGLANYRASEGKSFLIPERGLISETVKHYLGGIRSGMAYIDCKTMNDFREGNFMFVRTTNQLNRVFDQYGK